MFDISRFQISKTHFRKSMRALLSSTAVVCGFGITSLSNAANGCEHCQAEPCQSCQSCECSQCGSYGGPRQKPFSVRQLGSLVDGLDHMADHLERKLSHRHVHSHNGSCDCDVGGSHLTILGSDTAWSDSTPVFVDQAPTTSILKSQPRAIHQDAPVGTGVPGKTKQERAPLSPPPFDPSSVPSLDVPGALPHEDYHHNPFGDDARAQPSTIEKFKNRYTEIAASKTASPHDTKARNSAKPQYSHAYKPEEFIAKQKLAQHTAPAPRTAAPQNRVELASAKVERREGIRIKVGETVQAVHEPVSSQKRPAYEFEPSSTDLVQPAAALRLSN